MGKSKNIPFLCLENRNTLKNNSFIINPIPYIKKSLIIGKFKAEKHAVLYYKQKEICPICSENLINEFTHDAATQIYKPDFPLNVSDLSLINEKINIYYEPSIQNLNYDKFGIIIGAKWYKGLSIDYIIPNGLFNQMKNIRGILRSNRNLRLVHNYCYDSKMNHDKKMYEIFKKNIKLEISHRVNSLNPDKKLELDGKCFFSKIILDKISNNVNSKILKLSLLNFLENLALDKVYSKQYVKNEEGDIKYKQNKEINIVFKKLINTITSFKDETYINEPIKKQPFSHRLAALKRASDKKSRQIR